MTRLRRGLAPITVVWLFCQVGILASAPLGLWITASDPHQQECASGHEAGVMCPMHHKPAGRSAPCALRAANSSGAAVITTFVGVAGLISEPTLRGFLAVKLRSLPRMHTPSASVDACFLEGDFRRNSCAH